MIYNHRAFLRNLPLATDLMREFLAEHVFDTQAVDWSAEEPALAEALADAIASHPDTTVRDELIAAIEQVAQLADGAGTRQMLTVCSTDPKITAAFETLESPEERALWLYVNRTKLEKAHSRGENRIFYCAIPPVLYNTVTGMIAEAGLSSEGNNRSGWARIVVEKPFGTDLRSAQNLNQKLLQGFRENQIYRIDHYLAKETVQNILVLRFANAIFEPLWMRNYIDYVSIVAAEAIGIEHRAGYYESAGVLRDMVQNHMMQLLAMTAMEPPSRFEADLVP